MFVDEDLNICLGHPVQKRQESGFDIQVAYLLLIMKLLLHGKTSISYTDSDIRNWLLKFKSSAHTIPYGDVKLKCTCWETIIFSDFPAAMQPRIYICCIVFLTPNVFCWAFHSDNIYLNFSSGCLTSLNVQLYTQLTVAGCSVMLPHQPDIIFPMPKTPRALYPLSSACPLNEQINKFSPPQN